MRSRRRVAITGLGVKAPGGSTAADLWSTLRRGRSVAAPITTFDASSLPVTFACEVGGFTASDYVSVKEARRLDRAVQLAIGAGLDAVADAGGLETSPDRCGVVVGTGLGGVHTLIRQLRTCFFDSCERMSPLGIPMLMPNAPAANLSMLLGWTGPNMAVTTACAAGAHAIGEAGRLVREGAADVMLAGGTEACITAFAIGSFWRMGVLSERNDAPAEACRPFDRARDGFVLGEGAGFVVLEEWQRARDRGAVIHAELVGYGRNCDASHVSSPSPGGVGAAACMELALADGELEPSDVIHVNAHGTGTQLNDEREAEALVKVFGSSSPPVTAPKGTIGHLLGGGGAVEAIATLLSVEHREAPPSANFVEAGPDMTLDVVAGTPRPLADGVVLSNSFGFGGHNASLVFGPARPDQAPQPLPADLDGESLSVPERLVVSPVTGRFQLDGRTLSDAGPEAEVRVGELLGRVGDCPVRSRFAGRLMGVLALPGERVMAGQPIAWIRT